MKTQQIVRCIRSDIGSTPSDLRAGAAYCRRISVMAGYNGNSEHQADYGKAAEILEQQAAESDTDKTVSDGFGSEWVTPCPDCNQPVEVVRPGKVQCGC